ncbi:MAG: DNA mismatch repair protein MutS [Anaerolineae bacterium]
MTRDEVTPIRRQYLDIKKQFPDTIVFFRLGDFYETFDADAELVARELDIVLTSRNVAKNRRIPMAGVPHHALEGYVAKLIERGYHVAIADQVGPVPKKGLVDREVTRVMTPGTVVEPTMLDERRNNYIVALAPDMEPGDDGWRRMGLAYADVTTGEFAVTQITEPEAVVHELTRLAPREVVLPQLIAHATFPEGTFTTPLPGWRFDQGTAERALLDHFRVATLQGFGIADQPFALQAAGALLGYLQDTQRDGLAQIKTLRAYSTEAFMALDAATRRNLELTETLRGGRTRGSLLGVLDRTATPMGARLLRQWVSQPLLDREQLNRRLDAVEALFGDAALRAEMVGALKSISDLERLTNRVLTRRAGPRDLLTLRASLEAVPALTALIERAGGALARIGEELDACADVSGHIAAAIADEPPATLDKVGVIRPGYSQELDDIANASRNAKDWVAGLEKTERKRTGIGSLKVGYNKVFGYYIEVTKANAHLVPEAYIRKQTLVNAERYITPELKEYESLILNAEERILEIEGRLFKALCAEIAAHAPRLLRTARAVARLDVVAALAEVAAREGYTRPTLTDEDVLTIREGRHPVVEQYLVGRRFVPNDVAFTPDQRILIITGPNMAGKSVALRQAALIVLMAQIGSFVPAAEATVGIVDRIFTRIGAQDEVSAGQSTFMVEMTETALILNQATARSLLVLDEIGRGTSTYDGMSLAWAIVEYLHNHPRLKAKTLFATHYHELTDLEKLLPAVKNFNMAVAEEGDSVVFLYKMVPGGADRSYGIHVAQLAGLPRAVTERAKDLLAELERTTGRAVHTGHEQAAQLALFPETSPLVEELARLDIATMSPLEAISKLYEWQRRFVKKDEA